MKAIDFKFVAAMGMSLAFIVLGLLFVAGRTTVVQGSTIQGSEYQGTTTTAGNFLNDVSLNAGQTLGSVVITGAAAGTMDLYDATTSNVNLRTGNLASSSILLASFPTNAAVGTYTFDRIARYGVYVHIVGAMPTTTITFR